MNPHQTRTVIGVMAHSGAQQIFDRHMPLWKHTGFDIVVFTPETDPVVTAEQRVIHGIAQQFGHHLISRWKAAIRRLLHENATHFLLLESDSFLLNSIPEQMFQQEGLWSNVMYADPRDGWGSPVYFHFPMLIDKHTAQKAETWFDTLPNSAEQGFIDRWLGLLFHKHNLPFHSFERYGYSQNTIHPDMLPGALQARRDGAIFWHGIKTPDVLDAILHTGHAV